MKRLSAIVAAALLFASVSTSNAASVGAQWSAFAIWKVGRTGSGASRIVGAAAWASRSPGNTRQRAHFAFFEGICRQRNDERSCAVSSDGFVSGRAKKGEVIFDEAMRSALLKVARGGWRSEVAWGATAGVEPSAGQIDCGGGQSGAVAVASRAAEASGKVMGRKVRRSAQVPVARITLGAHLCAVGAPALREVLARGGVTVDLR